jgi:hypothetical protein
MGNEMMFLAYDTVEVQALECNHMKTEVNLLKFCQAVVLYEFMASNWIVGNMHYSVICSLVPQVRATVVLSIISEHVFIIVHYVLSQWSSSPELPHPTGPSLLIGL